jgi:hypothetical protein
MRGNLKVPDHAWRVVRTRRQTRLAAMIVDARCDSVDHGTADRAGRRRVGGDINWQYTPVHNATARSWTMLVLVAPFPEAILVEQTP